MFPTSSSSSAGAAAAAAAEANLKPLSSSSAAPPSVSFDDETLKENADNVDHRRFRKTPHPEKKKTKRHHPAANKGTSAEAGSGVYVARLDGNYDDNEEGEQYQDGIAATPGSSGNGRSSKQTQATMQRWSDEGGTATARASSSGSHQDASTADPTLASFETVPIDKRGGAETPKATPPSSGARYGNAAAEVKDNDEDMMEDVEMDGAHGGAESSTAQEGAPEWAAFCDAIQGAEPPSSAARQNLAQYQHAQALRHTSRNDFQASYESRIQGTMVNELRNTVHDVNAYLAEWSEASAQQGDEVGQRMKANQVRRELLGRQVRDSFQQLEATCRGLAASVMNQAGGLCGGAPAAGFAASPSTDDSMAESSPRVAANEGDPEGNVGPEDKDGKLTREDWDALLAYEPMRENTQALLDANAYLAQVEGRLSEAVTTASAGMHKCLEGLEEATGTVFDMFSEALGSHEDGIQAEMVRNLERRLDFEAAVRAQAEESQSYFQHLMTNIRVACGGAGGAVPAPRADAGDAGSYSM